MAWRLLATFNLPVTHVAHGMSRDLKQEIHKLAHQRIIEFLVQREYAHGLADVTEESRYVRMSQDESGVSARNVLAINLSGHLRVPAEE